MEGEGRRFASFLEPLQVSLFLPCSLLVKAFYQRSLYCRDIYSVLKLITKISLVSLFYKTPGRPSASVQETMKIVL